MPVRGIVMDVEPQWMIYREVISLPEFERRYVLYHRDLWLVGNGFNALPA